MIAPHADRAILLAQRSSVHADVKIVDLAGQHDPLEVTGDGMPVVVLTHRIDDSHAEAAAAIGASRVLSLGVSAIELLEAVEEARGETATCAGGEMDPSALSRRESEVLAGICRGLTNAEVAQELYLSVNSVKTYIRSGYRKIGVDRRSQAVRWGIENGYLSQQ
jgi:DNA-binding NarL/FixJ family response regulator